MKIEIDPKLDLVLEKIVPASPEQIYKAWTDQVGIKNWFCPKPWLTVECEMELRPGGKFFTVMQSPEGQKFPSTGCFLELVPYEKLVWTSALQPGFRPSPKPQNPHDLMFTATLLLEKHPEGTKYTAIAMHQDEEGRKVHEQMGFHDGWGMVVQQLAEYLKNKNSL